MMMQSRYGQDGDTAVLRSRTFNLTRPTWLTFYYYRRTSGFDSTFIGAVLKVYLVDSILG